MDRPVLDLAGLAAVVGDHAVRVHVSNDAMPQNAQGGFVTASLSALLLLVLASSSSATFFFSAARHQPCTRSYCGTTSARADRRENSSAALRRSPSTSSRQACRIPRWRGRQSAEEGAQRTQQQPTRRERVGEAESESEGGLAGFVDDELVLQEGSADAAVVEEAGADSDADADASERGYKMGSSRLTGLSLRWAAFLPSFLPWLDAWVS